MMLATPVVLMNGAGIAISVPSRVWRDLVDGLLEDRHRQSPELVHRRADDDDGLSSADHPVLVPNASRPVARPRAGARRHQSEERHLAGGDPVGVAWLVSNYRPQAGLGEGEARGRPTWPPPPRRDVEIRVRSVMA
jgi:hypothetical protein